MDDGGAERLVPRTPIQRRAQSRCDAVLAGARELLEEGGLSGFSIPALAVRLGFPRASIYNFFPTPQAVLNELARLGLAELEERLYQQSITEPTLDWKKQISNSMDVVARFYDERPVDGLLILGTTVSDDSYRNISLTYQHLGDIARRFFDAAGVHIAREPVDVLPLAVALGTTCLRHSMLAHGRITPEYQRAASGVMLNYLEPHVQAAPRQSRPPR